MESKVQNEIIDAIVSIMKRYNMTPEAGITETLNAITLFLDTCARCYGYEEQKERTAFIKGMYQQIIDQL